MRKSSVILIIFVMFLLSGMQGDKQHVYAQKNEALFKERICHRQRCHLYFKY